MGKESNEPAKRTVLVKDAVPVYKTLSGLNLSKLKKEDAFAVIRATNALRPVASAFEEFFKDAQERLKPENWDSIMEKRNSLDSLPEAERTSVNKTLEAYNKDINDCLQAELERETEVADFPRLSEEAIVDIALSNGTLVVSDALLLQDVAG